MYFFETVREKAVKKLVYSRYDLEKRNWDTEPSELDLPDNAAEFSAILRQQTAETSTPGLALKLHASSKPDSQHLYGIIYLRYLNTAGADWSGGDWIPLVTPELGWRLGEPRAWIETATTVASGSCFITETAKGGRSYPLPP